MIRIVLAEDQQMLLGALGSLLDLREDMEVVGMAPDGEKAVEMVERLNPDICIMDIEMPGLTGLEAAEKLKDHSCRIIILTTFARGGYFEHARRAGVDGYLLKDSPSEELADAVYTVMEGRRVYAPELIDQLYDNPNPLTAREMEIMQLIADGHTTKQIAGELFLTNGTVRNYVSTLLDKLEVKNRIEAISLCRERGWIR
ncbi:response regulator transcription factor [Alkalicoccus urumqiensis]|uniref:DNA-binding response regulator n=1 Tax=Alkalicoccus urumqiensis TaxID=1548213 RepID=A0A2P6MJ63_ALKUR|nr:response regulator transcription factor [Alkalicoccus urumqiensis]PRO66321.1 DNA-binding response regulator [Alkalicoccus urumqiensis]